MFDVLPVPNITAKDNGEKITQVVDFLFQFREELEFLLTGIASGDYARLTTKPTIENTSVASTERQLTVAEVINSAAFKAALEGVKGMSEIVFLINFETGNLEYEIK